MIEFIASSPYFSIALTIGAFCLASFLNKKLPSPFTTPLLVGTLLVLGVLLSFDIPYKAYDDGAKYIRIFFMPVVVCFAVPIYKHRNLLIKNIWIILLSILIGVICSVLAVVILSFLFGLGDIVIKSLVSISVTTAMAIAITERLGGIVALTTSAVIITGVLGASISDWVCRISGLKNPIARGLAIGNASHTGGTIKAIEMGQLEGATSRIAIVISGIMTAIIAPLIVYLFF